METIALAMEKGGVLKTSGTYNLATIKASEGKKVLMVDMDPQASLTISCGMGFISSSNFVGNKKCLTIVQKHRHTEEIWRVRAAYGVQPG